MNKLEVTFSKSAQSRRGCGHISWSRFEAILRNVGMLNQGEHLEKVTVDKEKILYSTDKTGSQNPNNN